jgi:hypothetical protein
MLFLLVNDSQTNNSFIVGRSKEDKVWVRAEEEADTVGRERGSSCFNILYRALLCVRQSQSPSTQSPDLPPRLAH